MQAGSPGSWYLWHWRQFVLGTLFLTTFLNYFDRQTLGTVMDPIGRDFGLDNAQPGLLLSAYERGLYPNAQQHARAESKLRSLPYAN